jgi:hypothetical protein
LRSGRAQVRSLQNFPFARERGSRTDERESYIHAFARVCDDGAERALVTHEAEQLALRKQQSER